jgi:hypothetical protein
MPLAGRHEPMKNAKRITRFHRAHLRGSAEADGGMGGVTQGSFFGWGRSSAERCAANAASARSASFHRSPHGRAGHHRDKNGSVMAIQTRPPLPARPWQSLTFRLLILCGVSKIATVSAPSYGRRTLRAAWDAGFLLLGRSEAESFCRKDSAMSSKRGLGSASRIALAAPPGIRRV